MAMEAEARREQSLNGKSGACFWGDEILSELDGGGYPALRMY